MESGQNSMEQPLLSVTIPTWNRAQQLKEALTQLLPQLVNFSDIIELIICDNASEDETISVIKEFQKEYSQLDFRFFQQQENTGYFGNFQTCIAMGRGKYLWLLSDDDYVFEGILKVIIKTLQEKEVGAIFLYDWTKEKDKKEDFSVEFLGKEEFFSDEPYRHSLISGVIYSHQVKGDDPVFEELKGNALIGYAVFLKAVHSFDTFAKVKGNSLLAQNDATVRFNGLWVFTVELAECLKIGSRYYSEQVMTSITNSFLSSSIKTFYKQFKFEGRYDTPKNHSLSLFKPYLTYQSFWTKILPMVICPKSFYPQVRRIKQVVNRKKYPQSVTK